MTASGDYKSPVSNNVSLGGRGQQQYFVVSKSSGFGGPTVTSIKGMGSWTISASWLFVYRQEINCLGVAVYSHFLVLLGLVELTNSAFQLIFP